MKVKGERKEIVWTLTLTDAEMASVHCVLHHIYHVTATLEARQHDYREHRENIMSLLQAFNDEANRLERDG